MNDKKLANIGNNVLSKAGINSQDQFGSVIAILMVISIIISLVRAIQECNKSKTETLKFREKCDIYGTQIRDLSKRRGWFTKMRIKKLLRRELSREDYIKYSFRLTEAILDIGENLTQDEIITLVEASNV